MPLQDDGNISKWLRSGASKVTRRVILNPSFFAGEDESLSWEEHRARYRQVVRHSASQFKEVLEHHGPEALRQMVAALEEKRDRVKDSVAAKRENLERFDSDTDAAEALGDATNRALRTRMILEVRWATADAVLHQWLAFSEVDVEEVATELTAAEGPIPPIPPDVSPSRKTKEVCEAILKVTDRPEHLLNGISLKDLFSRVVEDVGQADPRKDDAWRTPYGTLHEWTKRNLSPEYWTGDASGIVELAKRLMEEKQSSIY